MCDHVAGALLVNRINRLARLSEDSAADIRSKFDFKDVSLGFERDLEFLRTIRETETKLLKELKRTAKAH